ncbi:PilZ domain-containing protein [Candidatus Omnitrophota bacterium]
MIILAIQALCILVLIMIFATLIIDQKKNHSREKRLVKLQGYWDGSERRTTERLNISLPVKYNINGIASECKSMDLSARGIRLLLDERLETGTSLLIEIQLPEQERPVRAKGDIVWMKESTADDTASEKRLFNTGIQFSSFYNSDAKRLFNFVHSL